ncbi:hypothetical protein ST47_g1556 [Ascochyta rabiei]|uniref:Rhodopsin domain-containing protein n=1 Tax=Didymella rabiei TaxID=5454 RepID=A0A163KWM3_DIDRA|nr:hypothetical protein ST47_g1556 [Ascochyta rabiei]
MADAEPIPNRKWEIIAVSIVFMIIGTAVITWRVIVRANVARWMGPSDWFMILGTITNDIDCILNVMAGISGAGRPRRDPFLTIVQGVQLQKYLFMGQILNIYALFLIKLSICAYLLALNFSKAYRYLMWVALAFVIIFNFILPSVSLWGLCRPLAARWDSRIEDKLRLCTFGK